MTTPGTAVYQRPRPDQSLRLPPAGNRVGARPAWHVAGRAPVSPQPKRDDLPRCGHPVDHPPEGGRYARPYPMHRPDVDEATGAGWPGRRPTVNRRNHRLDELVPLVQRGGLRLTCDADNAEVSVDLVEAVLAGDPIGEFTVDRRNIVVDGSDRLASLVAAFRRANQVLIGGLMTDRPYVHVGKQPSGWMPGDYLPLHLVPDLMPLARWKQHLVVGDEVKHRISAVAHRVASYQVPVWYEEG